MTLLCAVSFPPGWVCATGIEGERGPAGAHAGSAGRDGWKRQRRLCPHTCPQVSRRLLEPHTHTGLLPGVCELLVPPGTWKCLRECPRWCFVASACSPWSAVSGEMLLGVKQRAWGDGWDGTSVAAAGWTVDIGLRAAGNEYLLLPFCGVLEALSVRLIVCALHCLWEEARDSLGL